MKRFITYLFGFAVLSMSFMCAEGGNDYSPSSSENADTPVAFQDESSKFQRTDEKPASIVDDRKLIKNGELEFEVKNIKEAEQKIRGVVQQYSGYISYENETNNDYQHEVNMKIRVPAKQFDALTQSLLESFDQFDKKNINVSDVTEEFLDIEARLKTEKALEQRYLGLLSKAKNVKEILEVERELANIRGEIERMEGRMKYLQNQTNYSTLSLRFYKETPTRPVIKENRYSRAFQNGWQIIVELSLLVVTLWPLILLGSALIIWLLRRRKTNKQG